jgi:hypothetical protein
VEGTQVIKKCFVTQQKLCTSRKDLLETSTFCSIVAVSAPASLSIEGAARALANTCLLLIPLAPNMELPPVAACLCRSIACLMNLLKLMLVDLEAAKRCTGVSWAHRQVGGAFI